MVLNACRSAAIDSRAADRFASTTAALLKARVRTVVAMGYDLYVSGAQQFVPAFYRRQLKSGDVAEATPDGRNTMLLNDVRTCARGTGSMIFTSSRGPDEWLAMFADPMRAHSAIDRLTSNACDLVIEGESFPGNDSSSACRGSPRALLAVPAERRTQARMPQPARQPRESYRTLNTSPAAGT